MIEYRNLILSERTFESYQYYGDLEYWYKEQLPKNATIIDVCATRDLFQSRYTINIMYNIPDPPKKKKEIKRGRRYKAYLSPTKYARCPRKQTTN